MERDSLGRFPKNDITGHTNINSKGILMTVVKYVNSDEIYVKFDGYEEIKRTTASAFKKGLVKCDSFLKESHNLKIGEERYNNAGEKMIIINYKSVTDIDIVFPKYNEIVKNVQYTHFKRGEVKSVYTQNVYNKGFLGRREPPIQYVWSIWSGILERCFTDRYPNYNGCKVCDEWLNYCNFEKWYLQNEYPCLEKLHIDKDVLSKDSKIYSPSTCLLIPRSINCYISTRTCRKKDGLPTGVYVSKTGKVRVIKNFDGRVEKRFNTIEEGEQWYINCKNEHYQKLLSKYKDIIPTKTFNILKKYKFVPTYTSSNKRSELSKD